MLVASIAIADDRPPNVLLMVSDDQGYHDLGCFGSSEVKTPHLDSLAAQGVRLTNFYVTWPACTPSRGSLLTGRYPQRHGVYDMIRNEAPDYGHHYTPAEYAVTFERIGGMDVRERLLPELLKPAGYVSGIFGKWDLGVHKRFLPLARGFDDFYGFCNTGIDYYTHERYGVPSMYRNNRPTIEDRGVYCTTLFQREALRFLSQYHKQPFFLYVPLSAPHGPIVPSQNWKGKSGINAYADFVMETDNAVERILKALDERGLANNTLVFFTADNGCSPVARFDDLKAVGHDPSGGLRGHKADIWEGGHRVPYIVRWPGVIKAGSQCDDAICHNNLIATCAELLGTGLTENAGVDSFSILPLLKGQAVKQASHPVIIHASLKGNLAIRQGKWKYIACKNSGGWSKGGDNKPAQLYNLAVDRAESNNLIGSMPEKEAKMRALLEKTVADGYSVPGKRGSNDVEVIIDKE